MIYNKFLTIIFTAIVLIPSINYGVNTYNPGNSDVDFTIREPLKYGVNTKIGFELVNASGHPIWVTVVNNGKAVINAKEVKPHGIISPNNSIQAEILTNKESIVAVWLKKPENSTVKAGLLGFGSVTINPAPDFTYTFNPGKTVYVTFNKNHTLTATKPEMVDGNKTASDLSLENNVNSDIAGQSKSCPVKK